jgi:multidrug efflux pump subunit AcrA (membrane-fusion protein)
MKKKLIGSVIIIVLIAGAVKLFYKSPIKVQYQTATAETGTLITNISGSGTITSGNYTSLDTKVSGLVSKVYVTNGDKVTKGQKIAEINLDDYAKERQAQAWVDYLSASEAVKQAVNDKALADINMWKARQDVLDAQEDYDNKSGTDNEEQIIIKTLDQSRKAFSVAESKYLDADANTANAYAKVSAALRDYQENSATITAPSTGVISDLSLAPELVLNANSSTSTTNGATLVSSQTIGKITNPKGQLIATVSLTEADVIKVKPNQKATLTLDAYSDKTFTGKVLSVNTDGKVSSGVTSYPVTIILDSVEAEIYPNMSVTAKIITNVKDNVVLVPSASVQTNNGQTQVRTLVNEKEVLKDAQTGLSNDTQTEIVSGIKEGETVITGTTTPSTTTTSTSGSSGSVFGRVGGNAGFGDGVRVIGR